MGVRAWGVCLALAVLAAVPTSLSQALPEDEQPKAMRQTGSIHVKYCMS